MSRPAIRVDGVWKEYVVGQKADSSTTFYDVVSNAVAAPFRRMKAGAKAVQPSRDSFWALKDVSFEVQPGEVVGVIGRNGAGKSTLLKVLSRITAPTRGRVEVRGRLASLLEVGTGFHPELSGRENIYLNGAILGMTRRDIARKFDEIVAFAEVEKFIDTPVKRYSSGMYVRLAFAVAAHLETDVLIVDEVLAVGDSAFQEKCLAKMGAISQGGRTVLFVSHNQGAIARLCNRGIVLHIGAVSFAGAVAGAVDTYAKQTRSSNALEGATVSGVLAEVLRFTSISVNGRTGSDNAAISPKLAIEIVVLAESVAPLDEFRITICVFKQGELVVGLHDAPSPNTQVAAQFESKVRIPPLTLSPGSYIVDINAYSVRNGQWMVSKNATEFAVALEWHDLYEPTSAMGVINLPVAGTRRLLS